MDSIQRNRGDKTSVGQERTAKGDPSNPRMDESPETRASYLNTSRLDQITIGPMALGAAQEMPVVAMARTAYEDILRYVASRPAESGGILLGPVGSNAVTRFHFDEAGSCTSSSYSPDHVGLSRRMKQEWLPNGIDMKGFAHAHPGRLDWLTVGDLRYIRRLLLANDDMDVFVAPIVIPIEFRMRPIVVLRTDMNTPREARLTLY